MRLNFATSRKELMLQMINFSQLLENLLRWFFFHLEMGRMGRAGL
jgi:hypothetical protein